MIDSQESVQVDRTGFPWDTEISYQVDYDPKGTFDGEDHVAIEEKIRNFRNGIEKVLLGKADTSLLSSLEQRAVLMIQDHFQRLLSAHLPEDKSQELAELSQIYQETLKLHPLEVWEPRVFSEKPSPVEAFNMVYANTLIVLVNNHIDSLKKAFEGNILQAELAKFFKSIDGLPFFEQTSPRKKKDSENTERTTWNIPGIVADIQGSLRLLYYQAIYEDEEVFETGKKDLAKLIGQMRVRLSKDPSLLAEFNTVLHEILENQRSGGNSLVYKGTETKAEVEKRNNRIREELRRKGIDKLLQNTDDYVVYMHRTGGQAAENICKVGFATQDEIGGTATVSDSDSESAMNVFLQRHRGDTAVVLIRIPRDQLRKLDDGRTLPRESMDSLSGERSTAVIPPSWIFGYVLRENNELVQNSHFADPEYDKSKPMLNFS